jgi:hypothetical protein
VPEGFERLKKTAPFGGILRKASRPRVVTVTGARLGLQPVPAAAEGGTPDVAYLLPAYLFDLEGGWTDVQAVVTVPERYLTG